MNRLGQIGYISEYSSCRGFRRSAQLFLSGVALLSSSLWSYAALLSAPLGLIAMFLYEEQATVGNEQ